MRRNRWKTWLAHLGIAAGLQQLFDLGLGDPEAFRIAVAFYTLREIEQHIPKWRTNTWLAWVGAFGDVASAWAGAGLAWWLLP